uniref:Polyprotein protein n=1 Tax=Solanum tuberosum TaxID=4113 RepID=M1D9J0_SOLTU
MSYIINCVGLSVKTFFHKHELKSRLNMNLMGICLPLSGYEYEMEALRQLVRLPKWVPSTLVKSGSQNMYLMRWKTLTSVKSGTFVDAASRSPLTQAASLRIGQLAHSADRHAARLEASISGMIQTALTDVVTPLCATIDALAARIAVCEREKEVIEDVTALKATITALRRDVD